ncbi:hypothetical protein I302_102484 [Kwoniella bestiolae CBS 10118]|uniref:Uncharacterized protein n=1 Tax=Kwoniella bestiolae CBS 10118 TaxID=1296100 RepID=A0A1B9GF45_9TREE|nr:hypothetical protein I302_01174 [Kwoniella bestiolae CBS 10118]OCF29663.1 hypothetical protein I302_01174 [Kwoniella bestiolae CBS 10118]
MSPPSLSPNDISQRSLKLFNPNFKSLRPVRQPIKPSLAWSPLPPPAAEIDERPKFRVRRFKLWKEVTPELRRVVLDQRKRFHLRRYQSYAVPSALSGQRRLFPRLAQPGTATSISVDDANEWTWSTPYRIRPRLGVVADNDGSGHSLVGVGGLLTPPLSASESTKVSKAEEEEGLSEEVTKVSEVDLPPPPEIQMQVQVSDRPPGSISQGIHHQPTPLEDAHEREREGGPQPDPPPSSRSSSPPYIYWLPPLPPSNKLPWLDKSISKKTRKIHYQRLLEHKWILDQEHERRFRVAMRGLMVDIMVWQEDKTIPFSEWKKGRKWKDTVDLKEIEDTTEFFRKIRKKSTNVFLYLDPEEITYVPFRERVHELVKTEEDRKKRKKARKERKKREQEQQQQQPQEEEERQKEIQEEARRGKGDESPNTTDTSAILHDTSPIDYQPASDTAPAATVTTEDNLKETGGMISELSLFDKPDIQDGFIHPEQARELSDLLRRLRELRVRKTQLVDLLAEREMNKQKQESLSRSDQDEVPPISQTILETRKKNGEVHAQAGWEGSHRYLELQIKQGSERQQQQAERAQSFHQNTEPSSESESELNQMHGRYGSLNLDDDTALPPPLTTANRNEVSSSAFSPREIDLEVDLSDESHSQSSSFDGGDEDELVDLRMYPVKLHVHEADEDTLTQSDSMGDQRDTRFSGVEGILTSHVTLV